MTPDDYFKRMKERSMFYILVGRRVVPVADALEWARWYEGVNEIGGRIVAKDEVGDARVSTVFLGLDHSWGDGGEPLVFETMIFGGQHDEYQTRCSTWAGAEAMHAEALALASGAGAKEE